MSTFLYNENFKNNHINIKDFGAVGDGTVDDTIAIQNAIDFVGIGGSVLIPTGSFLIKNTLIITKPIRLYGLGNFSQIVVASSVSNSTDIIKWSPAVGVEPTLAEISSFRITSPTSNGRHGINIDVTNSGQHVSKLTISNMYITQLNGNAIKLTNPTNTDGYFASIIRDNVLYGGVSLLRLGDSVEIIRNTITGSHVGIEISNVSGAAMVVIEQNNFTSMGGAIKANGCYQLKIRNNQIEQIGEISGQNAQIELTNCLSTEIDGNNLNGRTYVNNCLQLWYCLKTNITGINVFSRPLYEHIYISEGSAHTFIEKGNLFYNSIGQIDDAAIGNLGTYTFNQHNSTSKQDGYKSFSTGDYTNSAGESSVAQGSGTASFGRDSRVSGLGSFAGSAFTILYFDTPTNTLYTSENTPNLVVGDKVGWPYSPSLGYILYNEATVTAVNGNQIIVSNSNNYATFFPILFKLQTHSPNTSKTGEHAQAEGCLSAAVGTYSNAINVLTMASGAASSAKGNGNKSNGDYSSSEGFYNVAQHEGSHIMGKWGVSPANYSWSLGNGTDASTTGLAAKILQDGTVTADGAYSSTGADYAEMFEWTDDNVTNEDRIGYFVTLDGDKIRKATSSDDYILGIVSANPSVIGDASGLRWQGKYVTDDWGRVQYHFVTIPEQSYETEDDEGNSVNVVLSPERVEWQPIINPDWDNNEPYVDRLTRPEWAAIGMMGKLLVRDDGTCEVNGYCKPNDDGVATSDTSGYRVIKRINNNIVQVLVK